VTLTLGLAYLTVLSHERNRQAQALYLRSQHQLLNSLIDPTPAQSPFHAELARQLRSNFTESVKDRWNDEVENAVRWVQTTDWNGVREGMEGAVARLLGLGLQKSREGIEEVEKQAGPKVQEAVDRSKAAARKDAEQAAAGVDRAAAATIGGAERASGAMKSGLDKVGAKAHDVAPSTKASAKKAAADAKAGMDNAVISTRSAVNRGIEKSHEAADKAQTEVQSTGAGTVDAARGALRNVVSRGIEKGKEVIGKAQEAVGLATEKVQSVSQEKTSSLQESDVEKALRARYETPKEFDKSAEEVLEERYRPINQRDNTVLRGV
jgi:altered-inheritance-of-mitochondria protein 5